MFSRDSQARCAPSARRLALACGLVVLAASALTVSPVQAAQTRVLQRTFGAAASTVPDPAPLSNPQGEAVDQETGDVYVADTGNNRVEKFRATGEFLLAFGGNVGGLGTDVCGGLVACAPGTSGSKPGQFTTAEFVAVDNDPSSPSFHDVYVGDTGDNLVSKFTTDGVLEKTWGIEGQLNGSTAPDGPFDGIDGIAVDASGNLFVITGTRENDRNQAFRFAQDGSSPVDFPTTRVMASNGLTVDPAGNLFKVNGDGSVEKLKAGGEDVGTVTRETEPPALPVSSAIAIEPSSGDLFVANAAGSIDHYSFNGSGQVIEPEGPPCTPEATKGCPSPSDSTSTGFAPSGIVVSDAAGAPGDTYVTNPSTGEVSQYGQIVTLPDVVTGAAGEVGPASATLNGTVNPDGISLTACEFEYVSDATLRELAGGRDYQELISLGVPVQNIFAFAGVRAPCEHPDGGEVGEGTEPVGVHVGLTGLTPTGDTYHYRLVAGNANGSSTATVQAFTTATPPAIEAATAIDITESSATLNATVNPDNGELESCSFEYGTSTEYGTVVPCTPSLAQIGSGGTPVPITAAIAKLKPNVTYHYRVVATNTAGTTATPDQTFFDDTSGGGLPDNRAYELVTPGRKNGALLGEDSALLAKGPAVEVAPDGSRLIGKAIQCYAGSGSCITTRGSNILGNAYELTRTGEGWITTPLMPAASEFPSGAGPWTFNAASGSVLYSMPTSPEGEDEFYVREPEGGRFVDVGPTTPPEDGPLGPIGGFAGSQSLQVDTPNYSHIAWETAARWPFDARTGPQNLYEYAGVGNSQPFLVGVTGAKGSSSLISACETTLGGPGPGAMSEDGTIVFFAAWPCAAGTGENATTRAPSEIVYARVDGEQADAHTVAVSEPSEREVEGRDEVVPAAPYPGCEKEPCLKYVNEEKNFASAEFLGASSDGSKVFFLSTQQLTGEASEDSSEPGAAREKSCGRTTAPGGCNLYEHEGVNAKDSATEGRLIDVSSGDTSGQGPRVQGVMALSRDGSHIYFVAKGVLTGAVNDRGQTAQEGANNLYVYERDAAFPQGRVSFIAMLPGTEVSSFSNYGGLANVTPDGRFLVFTSHGKLTADDTSVSGAAQLFRYDAATGRLIRLSIGEQGFNDNGNRSHATPCNFNGETCSEDADIIPQAIATWRLDPTMSDNGTRVFFASPVGLTPDALDDLQSGSTEGGRATYVQNVYEWEQEGVGSCPAGRTPGCVFLISDGRDVSQDNTALLLGSDTTGDNLFFATSDSLVASDTNSETDYYDARVCEPERGNPCIAEPPPALSPCLGEQCHGIPAGTPGVPAAPTVTFNGAGNLTSALGKPAVRSLTGAQKLANALKACKKQPKKKRAACEKQARRKYGPVKPRKANKSAGKRSNNKGSK